MPVGLTGVERAVFFFPVSESVDESGVVLIAGDSVLQYVAVCCSVQCLAVCCRCLVACCSVLQCNAVYCSAVVLISGDTLELVAAAHFKFALQHTATHCHTLQHTVTHYSTLQHTATH